jgi:hypothetical protein
MLARFFPQSDARNSLDPGISPAIDYVLGDTDGKGLEREHAPVVVRGDPPLMRLQLSIETGKSPYVSGSLNFSEDRSSRPASTWNAISSSLAEIMYPGMGGDAPHQLGVVHEKGGGLGFEEHFIGLCRDPLTGRAMTPFVKARDGKLLVAWTQLVNLSCGLTSPFDPARARLISIARRHRKSQKRACYEELSGLILMEVEQGRIVDRRGISGCLGDQGFEVSIDDSGGEGAGVIRFIRGADDYDFGGFLCSPDFRGPESIQEFREHKARRAAPLQDIERVFPVVATLLLRRAAAFGARYRGDHRLIGKLPGRPDGRRDIEHFAVIDPHLPEWREELMALFPRTLSIYENQQHNHGGNENPPEPGTIEINTSPRGPDQEAGNKDRGNREPPPMPVHRSRESAVPPRGGDLGRQEPDEGTPRAAHGDLGDLERTLEKLRRAREDAERVAGDLQILERARRHLRVINELDQKVLRGSTWWLPKTTAAKRPGTKRGSRKPAPPVVPTTPTTPGEF